MNMTVELGADHEGTLLLKVVTDDFKTQQDLHDKGGLELALRVADQAVNDSTDIRVIAAIDKLKRGGGDVLVELKSWDGEHRPRV